MAIPRAGQHEYTGQLRPGTAVSIGRYLFEKCGIRLVTSTQYQIRRVEEAGDKLFPVRPEDKTTPVQASK